MLEIEAVRMEFPADANIIVGQSHFIKTVKLWCLLDAGRRE